MPKIKPYQSKKDMKYIIFIIILFFSISLFAQENESNKIAFLEKQITIDGKHSENEWSDIESYSGFYNYFPIDTGLAENQTEVKIFHNGEFLYITAIYHDTESRNNVSSLKRDFYSDAMFLSDNFAVSIDPYNEGNNGYFFGVNASGVQYDALVGNINDLNSSWNTVWQSEVSVIGNDKYYEIAIPLDAINFNPEKNNWGFQFTVNDTKINLFTTLEPSQRIYSPFDLRITKEFILENLPSKNLRKFSILPSLAYNYAKDLETEEKRSKFIPGIDVQYNINSSLKLDATINPDFSQVEVDQQVTNLTRFAINFPERRKFFLENSDLFSDLGTYWVNPFYSRRIGSETDILAGVKLSGNISDKTRIGILNVQTKDQEEVKGKNYSVLVARQNISNAFSTSVFVVNSQQKNYFNRVAGANVYYKSKDNHWTSTVNYAKAFTNDTSNKNDFVNGEVSYQSRKLNGYVSYEKVNTNYIAETGFTPLLFNYDALTQETTREGYYNTEVGVQLKRFPANSKLIDWARVFWIENNTTFNLDNSIRGNALFISPFALRFKNRSYFYVTVINNLDNLDYHFDILQNDNYITPGRYNHTFGRIGYWSTTNKKVFYRVWFEYGQFYNGKRFKPVVDFSYRLLPRAVISASYNFNDINLNELGKKRYHLARLTTEIYINNKLNWTSYFQYSTQAKNFNINTRIQWEYKPLSFIYLVLTDNYTETLGHKNWGVSFKINRRLDF